MRLRLTPREPSFAALFVDVADQVHRGALLLAEVLASAPEEREAVVQALQEVERAADDRVHLVSRRLTSTFSPPFARRDVHALAQALDSCLDEMTATAQVVRVHRLGALPPAFLDVAPVLVRLAELTHRAMAGVDAADRLAEYWVEVNRLDNRADALLLQLRADLLDDPDLRRALRLRDVADGLHRSVGAFERLAHVVEVIALVEP
ncbi:DUF47 domain-containing protein [uncultured Pseudokineococcus sp.]|uniref:DUF47 domain-containing protein n=1 Tax=uncultured Pseudokineococcus sp. TaxID=1642928 RepID=UPI00262387DC|nr:DUF47 family protein [uncultured Pseudokineococcus sp.]